MKDIRQTGNHMINSECRRDYLSGTDSISLYIHIPFCLRKCRYCDFLSGPQTPERQEQYVQALIREIRLQEDCPLGSPVDTVFFGGGTPSVLSAEQIDRIMQALRNSFSILPDAEISMEMNPGTADMDKLRAFQSAGINRLSIGVQSMHDEELHLLGRIHSARQAKEAFEMARAAGFDNINIDLMSALPGQTLETWTDTLCRAVEWKPEHISAYSLIIEPGTPFAALFDAGKLLPLPDEETDRAMYHLTREYLARNGYARYEISNYALPGRQCRHNTGYWTGHPYLGFGIGAASYINNTRFTNTPDLNLYIDTLNPTAPASESPTLSAHKKSPLATAPSPQEGSTAQENPDHNKNQFIHCIRNDIHTLSLQEKMEEFMFLGLRMTAGVSAAEFASRFDRTMDEVYGDIIQKHLRQGLLQTTPQGYCLTERGTDVSNYVMADYLF